jgi:hypothetical protein
MSPRPVALFPTPRPAPHRAVLATRAERCPPDAGGSEFGDLDGLAAPLERRGAGSMRSSVNTTICVLEALLGHKRADGGRRRGPRRRPPRRPVRHARSGAMPHGSSLGASGPLVGCTAPVQPAGIRDKRPQTQLLAWRNRRSARVANCEWKLLLTAVDSHRTAMYTTSTCGNE